MSDVVGAQVTVTAGATPAAVLVVPPTQGGQEILRLINRDSTNSVFLGDVNVANTGAHGGLEVKAGESVAPFSLPPETSLYAFAAVGTPRVDVLRVVAD